MKWIPFKEIRPEHLFQIQVIKRLISCKWIFKKKEGIPDVEPPKYKVMPVAKGFI